MTLNKLPLTIEARRWIEQGLSLSGVLPLAQLERLDELLVDQAGDASLSLVGSRDQQGLGILTGRVQASLSLQCQRCLGPVRIEVDSGFTLFPLTEAQEIQQTLTWPDEYEPVVIDENGMVDLQQLIEEELLLALPTVARHAPDECQMSTQFGQLPAEAEQQLDLKKNPFAVLKSLT